MKNLIRKNKVKSTVALPFFFGSSFHPSGATLVNFKSGSTKKYSFSETEWERRSESINFSFLWCLLFCLIFYQKHSGALSTVYGWIHWALVFSKPGYIRQTWTPLPATSVTGCVDKLLCHPRHQFPCVKDQGNGASCTTGLWEKPDDKRDTKQTAGQELKPSVSINISYDLLTEWLFHKSDLYRMFKK